MIHLAASAYGVPPREYLRWSSAERAFAEQGVIEQHDRMLG